MYKILRTRDMVLEKDQIKINLAKIAANSTITNHSTLLKNSKSGVRWAPLFLHLILLNIESLHTLF